MINQLQHNLQDHHRMATKLNIHFIILIWNAVYFMYCYVSDKQRSPLDIILIGNYIPMSRLELEVYPLISGICILSIYFFRLLYFETNYNKNNNNNKQNNDDHDQDYGSKLMLQSSSTETTPSTHFTTITNLLIDILIHQQSSLFSRQQSETMKNDYTNSNIYVYLQKYTTFWVYFFQIFYIIIGNYYCYYSLSIYVSPLCITLLYIILLQIPSL